MYYLQAPKIGVLWSGGSLSPFRDYMVQGEWIMNLIQAGKMSYEQARVELIRSAKNLTRLSPCLDKWHHETKRLRLGQQIQEVQTRLAARRLPFRTIPAVSAWLDSMQQEQPRHKFLVLNGASGLGKTQYATSLVGPGKALDLNCASCPEPDLRDFDPATHELILFDEASAKMVVAQKKLFQGPAVVVVLGCSGTNCHAYKVWVYGVRMVVSSNRWDVELQTMPSSDADWLRSNSVFVQVTEQLWLP